MVVGDYDWGFENYCVCWDIDEVRWFKINLFEWDGELFEGKIVFVLLEQGFGDVVLMVCYLFDFKVMGVKVILIVEKLLLCLFLKLFGVDVVLIGIFVQIKIDFYILMMDLLWLVVSIDDDIRLLIELMVFDVSKD